MSKLGLPKLAKTANTQKSQKLWNQNWHKNTEFFFLMSTDSSFRLLHIYSKAIHYYNSEISFLTLESKHMSHNLPIHKEDISSFRKYHNRPLLNTVGKVGIRGGKS